jgi:hypothetical protein
MTQLSSILFFCSLGLTFLLAMLQLRQVLAPPGTNELHTDRHYQSFVQWKGPFGAVHTLLADFDLRNRNSIIRHANMVFPEDTYWSTPQLGKNWKIDIDLLPEFLSHVDLSGGPSHVTIERGGHIFDPYDSVHRQNFPADESLA